MKRSYRLVLIVVCLFIIVLFVACDTEGKVAIGFSVNESVKGVIKTNREPERYVSWKIEGDKASDIYVKIVTNDKIVYEDYQKEYKYKLDLDNTSYKIIFVNNSNKEINVDISCKYTRLGSSDYLTYTVTNFVKLIN